MMDTCKNLTRDDIVTRDEDALKQSLCEAIQRITSPKDLDQLRLYYMGKQGIITQALKSLGTLSVDDRRTQGPKFNALREYVGEQLQSHKQKLDDAALDASLFAQMVDVSLPVYPKRTGSHHLITTTLRSISDYFQNHGFHVADGPDMDDEYHNFDALNIPAHHPARQSHDTFYVASPTEKDDHFLLRTHTSTVQIRATHNQKPPLRVLAPGRVYRADFDATHLPMFHQVEGFVIEDGIHIGHLKGILTQFCRAFFEQDDLKIRFRPSFFPFTEPSFEMDMWWHNQWLEVLGCGMIHPNVLTNMGFDPADHQGFAFGLGVDRFTMLKYNVKDIRNFTAGDMRWLSHVSAR